MTEVAKWSTGATCERSRYGFAAKDTRQIFVERRDVRRTVREGVVAQLVTFP